MIPTIKRALSAIVGIPGQLELITLLTETRDELRHIREEVDTAGQLEFRESLLFAEKREVELRRRLLDTEQQLAAEREAHAETKQALIDEHHWRMVNHNNCNRLGGELNYANEKLASALDKLDKLTRWRKQSEEPCPGESFRVEWSSDGSSLKGPCTSEFLALNDYWRFTPESLKALEESEGGDG